MAQRSDPDSFEEDDPDDPRAEDQDDLDHDELICPHCGAYIWDGHDTCPNCDGDPLRPPPSARPAWQRFGRWAFWNILAAFAMGALAILAAWAAFF